MCGIAGVMTADRSVPDPDALDTMKEALAHRGPDGDAIWVSGDTGLVHTRLAIIDLKTGDQPLFGPGGTALVANGEIYNYIELREEMMGSTFQTESDCEPVLHYYRDHGADFAGWLRGMYALAIHDPQERRLLLARDLLSAALPSGVQIRGILAAINGIRMCPECPHCVNGENPMH